MEQSVIETNVIEQEELYDYKKTQVLYTMIQINTMMYKEKKDFVKS